MIFNYETDMNKTRREFKLNFSGKTRRTPKKLVTSFLTTSVVVFAKWENFPSGFFIKLRSFLLNNFILRSNKWVYCTAYIFSWFCNVKNMNFDRIKNVNEDTTNRIKKNNLHTKLFPKMNLFKFYQKFNFTKNYTFWYSPFTLLNLRTITFNLMKFIPSHIIQIMKTSYHTYLS